MRTETLEVRQVLGSTTVPGRRPVYRSHKLIVEKLTETSAERVSHPPRCSQGWLGSRARRGGTRSPTAVHKNTHTVPSNFVALP